MLRSQVATLVVYTLPSGPPCRQYSPAKSGEALPDRRGKVVYTDKPTGGESNRASLTPNKSPSAFTYQEETGDVNCSPLRHRIRIQFSWRLAAPSSDGEDGRRE